MTARPRRDNLRQTWVPTGNALRALERDSGVVVRFIIGRTCAARMDPVPDAVRPRCCALRPDVELSCVVQLICARKALTLPKGAT